jgi:hypothetical protein
MFAKSAFLSNHAAAGSTDLVAQNNNAPAAASHSELIHPVVNHAGPQPMKLPWVSDPTYAFGGGFDLLDNVSRYNQLNHQYNYAINDIPGDHNSQLFGGNMGNDFTGYGGRDVFYLGQGPSPAPDTIHYVSWQDSPIWSEDAIFNFDPALLPFDTSHDKIDVSQVFGHAPGHRPFHDVQYHKDPGSLSGGFFEVRISDDPYMQDSDTLHIQIHTGHSAQWDHYTKDQTPDYVANFLNANFDAWVHY